MRKVKVCKRQLTSYCRKHEKGLLLLVICLSASAPLIKYSLSQQGYHALGGNRGKIELRTEPPKVVARGGEGRDDSNGLNQQLAEETKELETPIVCGIAKRELAKWQACNKRKWKKIPSCKRGVNKCVLLPLFKQENTPFCVDCLEPWRKMDDCFKEAEEYFLTERRCVKVWQSVKNEKCGERSSAIAADVLMRVSQKCMLTNSKISKASVEVSKFKRIVPGVLEALQKQERQQRLEQRRAKSRGRHSRRRDRGPPSQQPPPEVQQQQQEEVVEEESNPNDPMIQIKVTPQYPTLDID